MKEATHDRLVALKGKLRAKKTHRNFGKNMSEVLHFLLRYFSFGESERNQNKDLEDMFQQLTLPDSEDKKLDKHIAVTKAVYDKTVTLQGNLLASETHRIFGKSFNNVIELLLDYFYTDQERQSGKGKTFLDE